MFIPVEAATSGSLVVLGSTVELPAPAVAAASAERCRERPRLLTPMLIGYAGLQAADTHSTLRALDAAAIEANANLAAKARKLFAGGFIAGIRTVAVQDVEADPLALVDRMRDDRRSIGHPVQLGASRLPVLAGQPAAPLRSGGPEPLPKSRRAVAH